jgi:hypothetical protein
MTRHACGTCSSLMDMIELAFSVPWTRAEIDAALERSRKSLEESTRLMLIRMKPPTNFIQ